MEAIIRTNDKEAFNSLIQFLKTLNFEVEAKGEKKEITTSKKQKSKFNEAEKFWRSLKVDMTGFKFNRADAYER